MKSHQLTALEKLDQCTSLEDMAKAFPECTVSPFNDPVVARLYDALLVSQRASMIAAIVDNFCTAIGTPRQGARILDVGCGSGRVILGLAVRYHELKCKLVGVDVSAEMIAIAKENCKEHCRSKDITFLCGTTLDLAAAEQTQNLDYLLIRNTISWMSDAAAELRIWLERLKPGGKIFISELRRDAHFPLLKTRIRNCLAFKANDITLAYPPSAMIAAYRFAPIMKDLTNILKDSGVAITIARPNEKDDVTIEPWGVDMFVGGVKP